MWVICAEDDEQARRLAASGRMAFRLLRRGELIAVPPPEEAIEFLAGEGDRREHHLEHEARRRSYELLAEAFGL